MLVKASRNDYHENQKILCAKTNIHHFLSIILDLADSMRRCAEYPDAPGRAVSHRFVGKCIPWCRWWDFSRLVYSLATSASDDGLHWCSLDWISPRACRWRLHQFVHHLVDPQRSSIDIC